MDFARSRAVISTKKKRVLSQRQALFLYQNSKHPAPSPFDFLMSLTCPRNIWLFKFLTFCEKYVSFLLLRICASTPLGLNILVNSCINSDVFMHPCGLKVIRYKLGKTNSDSVILEFTISNLLLVNE